MIGVRTILHSKPDLRSKSVPVIYAAASTLSGYLASLVVVLNRCERTRVARRTLPRQARLHGNRCFAQSYK